MMAPRRKKGEKVCDSVMAEYNGIFISAMLFREAKRTEMGGERDGWGRAEVETVHIETGV